MTERPPLSRRTVLTAGALGAVTAALPLSAANAAAAASASGPASGRPGPRAPRLRFRSDRTFKVSGAGGADPLYADDPMLAGNRRISIVLLREAPVLPANAAP